MFRTSPTGASFTASFGERVLTFNQYRTKTIALRTKNAMPFVTLGNWADCFRDAGVDMLKLCPYYRHSNGMWQQMSWWDHLYGTHKQGFVYVVNIILCPRCYNPWGGSLAAQLHNVSAADLRVEPTGEEIAVCVEVLKTVAHPVGEEHEVRLRTHFPHASNA